MAEETVEKKRPVVKELEDLPGVGEVSAEQLRKAGYDVEKIAMAMAKLGVEFESSNPTTSLMSDVKTGKFKDDVLNEKVLSAIIEFSVPLETLDQVLSGLKQVSRQIETVFSLCVASRVAPDGSIPTHSVMHQNGVWFAPNGKTNVGLGRPLIKEDSI